MTVPAKNILSILALSVMFHGTLQGALRADSVQLHRDSLLHTRETPRTKRFYDSLESQSTRRAIPRILYNSLFVRPTDNPLAPPTDESRSYAAYDGREIAEIVIARNNVFEEGGKFLERTANSLHVITRENVIRRDLLFRTGERLDPELVIANEQHLRQRPYIYEAQTFIEPLDEDTTRLKVVVYIRDSWTISVYANASLDGRTTVGVYDANLFGSGTRLDIATNFDWKPWEYGGNRFEYSYPNILGSFISAHFVAGRKFDYSDLSASVAKEFLRPTDYALGASYSDYHQPQYLIATDTVADIRARIADLWGGGSFLLPGTRTSVYFAGRFTRNEFDKRPETNAGLNPAFHNERQWLASVGLYRERFLTANLIYGYGFKEYMAAGHRAELVGGYVSGEFTDRWYLGLDYARGGFLRAGYLGFYAGIGSYVDIPEGGWSQSAARASVLYFSNLLGKGRTRLRQFVELSHLRGWNRLAGEGEQVAFTRETGLTTLDAKLHGTTRTTLNTETVVFTPLNPLGFRIALFGFADFGLIGPHGSPFRNNFYSTFGFGIRMRNERLIFNTIQIRLGLALGRGGLVDNQYITVSSEQRIDPVRYIPTRPATVEFIYLIGGSKHGRATRKVARPDALPDGFSCYPIAPLYHSLYQCFIANFILQRSLKISLLTLTHLSMKELLLKFVIVKHKRGALDRVPRLILYYSQHKTVYSLRRIYGQKRPPVKMACDMRSQVLTFYGDGLDLDSRAQGQPGYLVADAGGHFGGVVAGVDGVHRGKVVHIGQQDGRFDHIGARVTGGGKDRRDVLQAAGRLRLDALGDRTARRIKGQLARDIERSPGFDRLGIGTCRCRGSQGCDDLFHIPKVVIIHNFSNFTPENTV